jgi:DNA replication and repair protein RecF
LLQLNNISLTQFKNYLHGSFSFTHRIIAICGRNGIGKTNLLDAIYYLCFTKSYFSKTDAQNAHAGFLGFRIEGNFDSPVEPSKIVCILREAGRKEFFLNDEPYGKFAHHIGKFPCVFIAPDDVDMITEGGEGRRRFLDALLCQLNSTYLQTLMDYNKVLQQRNGYLKSIAERRVQDKSLMDVYDEQLIRYGDFIFNERKIFLSAFLPKVSGFYEQIARGKENVVLTYESQLHHTSFENLLHELRDRDIMYQRTHAGIHKDELAMNLNNQPFKNIASQGQRKSLLFALKLAEFEALKTTKGFPPILLLDDVFEKLDEQRMHNLLHWVCIQNEGQIFITDTHVERVREHFGALGVSYQLIELEEDHN